MLSIQITQGSSADWVTRGTMFSKYDRDEVWVLIVSSLVLMLSLYRFKRLSNNVLKGKHWNQITLLYINFLNNFGNTCTSNFGTNCDPRGYSESSLLGKPQHRTERCQVSFHQMVDRTMIRESVVLWLEWPLKMGSENLSDKLRFSKTIVNFRESLKILIPHWCTQSSIHLFHQACKL